MKYCKYRKKSFLQCIDIRILMKKILFYLRLTTAVILSFHAEQLKQKTLHGSPSSGTGRNSEENRCYTGESFHLDVVHILRKRKLQANPNLGIFSNLQNKGERASSTSALFCIRVRLNRLVGRRHDEHAWCFSRHTHTHYI